MVEVVCHLRDAEEISIQRMQAMRDRENPPITGYDQEALARDRHYQNQESEVSPGEFRRFSNGVPGRPFSP